MCIGGSFPVIELKRRVFDQSLKSGVEFKDEWNCSSAPPVCLNGWEREDFTLAGLGVFLVAQIRVTL
jgi:hypothetical protein